MKKIVSVLALTALLCCGVADVVAQSCYWVFLTDKQGSVFDPYSYFDAKAIERYRDCGADLHDISNYPLTGSYTDGVNAIAEEEVGQSRWLNAMAVMATTEQIERIAALPYVKRVQLIATDMQMAAARHNWINKSRTNTRSIEKEQDTLEDQLVRMQGQLFRDKGIDGKGIRIAVFDGGFPNVDKHKAFQHLRDGNRIVDTWNFPNKKDDVYGWNSHGTMTLSCITGVINGRQLGLATGSEFMLYRTEVEPEPFKEEVWWLMAVERADKHGANIISSSLGYGADRHFTKDMDGTSYVAKAGNLAARKGMLVCNSAGNEGDDRSWKTIITPADADSVICVGGITDDLLHYQHISFSSYGPSADGRLKPNVCAFGHAVVADHNDLDATTTAYGTSFSCPLTSGFAACAWQLRKGYTAMQMKAEIEHSADLYPYYDYAFGYGVPQASFFTEATPKKSEATFRVEKTSDNILIVPLKDMANVPVFFNVQQKDGKLYEYANIEVENFTTQHKLEIAKSCVVDRTLNIHIGGYTQQITLTADENRKMKESGNVSMALRYHLLDAEGNQTYEYTTHLDRDIDDNKTSNWGANNLYRSDVYYQLGVNIKSQADEQELRFWSPSNRVGFRLMRSVGRKWYCLGWGAEYGMSRYSLTTTTNNQLDALLNTVIPNSAGTNTHVERKDMLRSDLSLELFQRIRFVPGGSMHNGLHWDLGIFGSYSWYKYTVEFGDPLYCNYETHSFSNPKYADSYRWNWGVTTRIVYDVMGVYARYLLTGIGADKPQTMELNPTNFNLNLPRLEVGVTINF
ncbi:MAG: S8 family serine peptidase [Bacteroidales bacterium]|nr:S8 family serine peptidase [Bacteroidales bacterium]